MSEESASGVDGAGWDELPARAAAFGVELPPDRLPPLRRYVELLVEWNRYFNLTAIEAPDEILTKHLLDSLTVASVVDLRRARSLIDVGTGAGFPGLVLKIAYPHLRVVLLDALNKRLKFLDRVIAELGLTGVRTLHARAEDAASPGLRGPERMREQFDVVAARAVARLNVLSEWLLPFARVGGHVIAMKGPGIGEEVDEAAHALRLLGGGEASAHELVLPGSHLGRSLVVIPKERPTPAAYPRRPGSARKHPL